MSKDGKMEKEEKICVICGQLFKPRSKEQVCCSKYCSKERNNQETRKRMRLNSKGVKAATTRLPTQEEKKHTKKLADKRRCHDCGEPTPNYRCPDCLRKWREKHHISMYAEEVSEVGLFVC